MACRALLRLGTLTFVRRHHSANIDEFKADMQRGMAAFWSFAVMAEKLLGRQYRYTYKLHMASCHLVKCTEMRGHPALGLEGWVERLVQETKLATRFAAYVSAIAS